jgi:hypothetical protein
VPSSLKGKLDFFGHNSGPGAVLMTNGSNNKDYGSILMA